MASQANRVRYILGVSLLSALCTKVFEDGKHEEPHRYQIKVAFLMAYKAVMIACKKELLLSFSQVQTIHTRAQMDELRDPYVGPQHKPNEIRQRERVL